jgi:hypothetical protein
VDLREEMQPIVGILELLEFSSLRVDACAASFVRCVVTNAVDDLATDPDLLDFCDDEACPCSPVHDAEEVLIATEPAIAEVADENLEISSNASDTLTAQVLGECTSDSELDDCDNCEFDDDACSMVSEDMLDVAASCVMNAVSDDVITDALCSNQLAKDGNDNYRHFDQSEHVEFLGESTPFCDELAFDFASNILDAAFMQSTAWRLHDSARSAPATAPVVDIVTERSEEGDIEVLRQKARESLIKFAEAQIALKEEAQREKRRTEESLKLKVRAALSMGVRTGDLWRNLAAAKEESRLESVQNRANSVLRKAAISGKLDQAISELMRNRGDALQINREVNAESSSCLIPAELQEEFLPIARLSHSSRSRRRIIGGVVRSPAVQEDMALPSASPKALLTEGTTKKHQSKSKRKVMKDGPAPLCIDFGFESGEEDFSRTSSITRSYDAFDQAACIPVEAPAAGMSARKMSKAKSRLQSASFSAMAMDLHDEPEDVSFTTLRIPSMSSWRQSSIAMSYNSAQAMRPSASLGSLASVRVKTTRGGLLPILAAEKRSADSIAWSMQVSKTASKLCNTGLRGSASMIF